MLQALLMRSTVTTSGKGPGLVTRFFGFVFKAGGLDRTLLLTLTIRAGSVLAGFAVTFLLGRNLGAEATGQYALVIQTAMFLAVIGLFGLDHSVVRHLAKAIADQKPIATETLFKVLAIGTGSVALIAMVVGLAGEAFLLPFLGSVLGSDLLLILCLLVLIRGCVLLLGGILRSQHRFALAPTVSVLSIPLAAAIALVTGLAQTVGEALWAAAIGGFLAIIFALLVMARHVSGGEKALSIPLRSITASALPLWGTSFALVLSEWYGLAIAARTMGAAEAGLFKVGLQLAAILVMISSTLLAVYSAKISTAFHAGDRAAVASLARASVGVTATLALPLAGAIALASGPILGQIGPEFLAAKKIVLILIAGQVAQILTGPCGMVLAMSGNEKTNLAITICGAVLLLVLLPVAARFAGLEGLAACIAIIMLLRNFTAYLIVRYKLGINIWAGTAVPRGDAGDRNTP